MSEGRGARTQPPVTYEGSFDLAREYQPRQVVVHEGVAYMATARMQGVTPAGGGGSGTTTTVDNHDGTGADSTVVGTTATATATGATANGDVSHATGNYSSSYGYASAASGTDSTALGAGSGATASQATAVGDSSFATAVSATSLGYNAQANAARSFAIGAGSSSTVADTGVLKANDVQIDRSNGAGATRVIIHDSTGARWAVGVNTVGALTTTSI